MTEATHPISCRSAGLGSWVSGTRCVTSATRCAVPHRLLERLDRALAADEQRHDEIREQDEIPQRNQRKHIGNRRFSQWLETCCSYVLSQASCDNHSALWQLLVHAATRRSTRRFTQSGAHMSRNPSATHGRSARAVAAALALLAAGVLAHGAVAAPSSGAERNIAVSLVQSATAVPLDGTFGYSGVVRYASRRRLRYRPVCKFAGRAASSSISALSMSPLPRKARTPTHSRVPWPGLDLPAGSYPVTFSLRATVDGSDVDTEVATELRIYDAHDRPVPVVLLAKVHARPMTDPSGNFDGRSWFTDGHTGARRDRLHLLSCLRGYGRDVSPSAVPPVTLEEWRRIASSGYTLASGTAYPQPTRYPSPTAQRSPGCSRRSRRVGSSS